MEVLVIEINKILSDEIKERQKHITFKQLNDKYINQLAAKLQLVPNEEDFLNLLTIMYVKGSMETKIRSAVKRSTSPYCSEEDFFSVFYCELQKCLNRYNSSVGNFSNFAFKTIDVMYREQYKPGNAKRIYKTLKSRSNPEIGIRTMFFVDEKMMNDELRKKISDIEDGEIVLYKFFGDDNRTKSNQETAKHFNISTDEVNERIKKVFDVFKTNYPSFYEDYFFDLGENDVAEMPESA